MVVYPYLRSGPGVVDRQLGRRLAVGSSKRNAFADDFCAAGSLWGMAASGDVFLALSMSLDGYVAGPSDNMEPLQRWLFGRQGREPPWPRLEHGGGQPRRRRRRHASRRTACATPGVFDRRSVRWSGSAPSGASGSTGAARSVRTVQRPSGAVSQHLKDAGLVVDQAAGSRRI
jgi:hypothetical protein